MNALSKLLLKRRSQERSEIESFWDRYKRLYTDLAHDVEVDGDEADIVLDAVAKSEADLNADIELFRQRLEWHSQMIAGRGCDKRIEHAQQTIAANQQEINEVLSRCQPKIASAEQTIGTEVSKIHQAGRAEEHLATTVIDGSLLDRQVAINDEICELGKQRQEIDRKIKDCHLDNYKRKLAEFEYKKSRANDQYANTVEKFTYEIRFYKDAVKRATEQEKILRDQMKPIEKRLVELDQESTALREKMLEP